MKKKVLSICCSMLLMLGMAATSLSEAKASSEILRVDGSYLTHESESVGYAIRLTRGENLLNGYSKVVRLGAETIYAGGTTMAAHEVQFVQLSVMVERAASDGDYWEFVDSWYAENNNADRVASNRRMVVDGDYYYRVRCTHSADGDTSSSFTDGVYVEKR